MPGHESLWRKYPLKRAGPNTHADGSGGCNRFGPVLGARRVYHMHDTLLGCPVAGLALSELRGLRQIEYENAVLLPSICLRSARCHSAGRCVSWAACLRRHPLAGSIQKSLHCAYWHAQKSADANGRNIPPLRRPIGGVTLESKVSPAIRPCCGISAATFG